MRVLIAAGAVIILSLAGCTSSSESQSEKTAPAKAESERLQNESKPTESPEPEEFDESMYSARLEKAYVTANGGPIKDSCDDEFTNWQCFYDRMEVNDKTFITVYLSFPGDYSKNEIRTLSEQARLAWFNFVGSDFKSLDLITTNVNSLDIGTTTRADVPLLNR